MNVRDIVTYEKIFIEEKSIKEITRGCHDKNKVISTSKASIIQKLSL